MLAYNERNATVRLEQTVHKMRSRLRSSTIAVGWLLAHLGNFHPFECKRNPGYIEHVVSA